MIPERNRQTNNPDGTLPGPDDHRKERERPMSTICGKCRKTVETEGVSFCPYCGEKLDGAREYPEARNEEAEKWIEKAMAVASFPERKKILLKGLKACPGAREIEWEMLFIGEGEPKKKGRFIDFSIIQCWALEIYRKPEDFSGEERDRMRGRLFESPRLKKCFCLFEDPERKQKEYLLRLCREYIEIFLEGNSQVMGTLFGFQIGRNREKRLAGATADVMQRIREDEKLLPEQREQLWQAMYQAYGARSNGKTEHLDEMIHH